MTYKLLAVAAITLSLGSTSALAQTATETTGTAATGTAATGMQDRMPVEWEGAVGDAFYEDTELGTLRDEDDMRASWDDLGDDDREAVRDYCERFAMMDEVGDDAAAGTGTATTGTAATDTATTGTTGTATTGTAATGAADPLADTHHASIQQICELIEDDDAS
jgi:hypothetical protein